MPDSPDTADIVVEPDRSGTRLTFVFLLIGAAYVLYGWDRLVVPVELVEMRRALALTPQIGGLMASIFTLGIAIMSVPAALVVARLGLRRALGFSMMVFSAGTLMSGAASSIPALVAGRIGTGMGEAVFSIALFTFVTACFPKRSGTAIGAATAVFGLSMFVGPRAIVALQHATGAWRGPFLLLGGLGVLGALALLALLPRDLRRMDDDGRARDSQAALLGFWRACRPGFPATLVVALANGVGCYAYMSLFQSYARLGHHLTPAQASFAFGCFGMGTVLGGIPIGYVLDRTDRQIGLAVITALTGMAGLALMMAVLTPASAVWLSLLLGVGIGGVYGNCYALIREQAPEGRAPLAIGILLTVYYAGASVSGYLFVVASGAGFAEHARCGVVLYLLPYGIAAMIALASAHARRASGRRAVSGA